MFIFTVYISKNTILYNRFLCLLSNSNLMREEACNVLGWLLFGFGLLSNLICFILYLCRLVRPHPSPVSSELPDLKGFKYCSNNFDLTLHAGVASMATKHGKAIVQCAIERTSSNRRPGQLYKIGLVQRHFLLKVMIAHNACEPKMQTHQDKAMLPSASRHLFLE